MGLSLIVWGAVLCLTALMVGTLSDERAAKTQDLHEAYIGVVEVLSRYLQSANPVLEAKSNRVANLSQKLARQLRLSPQDVDDIGVAALLHDVGNIEITAKVIQKAMGNMKGEQEHAVERTFQGTDLVRSLGSVLRGAAKLQGFLLVNNGPTSIGVGAISVSGAGFRGPNCKAPRRHLRAPPGAVELHGHAHI
jgi:hypothetical protein